MRDGRLSGSAAGRGGPEYFRYFGWVFVTWVRGAGAVAMMNATLGPQGEHETIPAVHPRREVSILENVPCDGVLRWMIR